METIQEHLHMKMEKPNSTGFYETKDRPISSHISEQNCFDDMRKKIHDSRRQLNFHEAVRIVRYSTDMRPLLDPPYADDNDCPSVSK